MLHSHLPHVRNHGRWPHGSDIPGEFRRLQNEGRLEITTSAATHALLPLLARDASIRLQLAVANVDTCASFSTASRTSGSCGPYGDFSMWLNAGTEWMWPVVWELEERFWAAAPTALR